MIGQNNNKIADFSLNLLHPEYEWEILSNGSLQANGKYYLKPANDEVDANGNKIYKDIHPKGIWEIIGVVDNVIHCPDTDVI